MTYTTVLFSVLFVVSAVIFNFWIIFTYSAPVFQEMQRRIVEWVKKEANKSEGEP